MNIADMGIKHFNSIPGVLLPADLNIGKIEEVSKGMEKLVDLSPALSSNLQEGLTSDKQKFQLYANECYTMLSSVYARKLVTDLERIVNNFDSGQIKVCETLLEKFISELLDLSIAVQKASIQPLLDKSDYVPEVSTKVGNLAATVSDLSAVKYLIDNLEFDRALEMIDAMPGIEVSDKTPIIRRHLRNFNGDSAIIVVQKLIDEFTQKILGSKNTEDGTKKKILAVDDRPEILTVLSEVLKDEYHMLCVPSAEAALRVLDKHHISLFILDIEMPRMNGLELATMIKAKAQFKKTPLVFLTGNATKEYLIKAMSVGASDFIVKPIVRENIIFKVKQYTSN